VRDYLRQENVHRFRRLLDAEAMASDRTVRRSVVRDWERELALIEADAIGALRGPLAPKPVRTASGFQREFEAIAGPALLLHPGPGLHIIQVNEAYARASCLDAARVPGDRLFTVFPDNPQNPEADGVSRLFASLRMVAQSGRQRVKPLQRYDVRDANGAFVERWWRSLHTPVFAESCGRLRYLLVEVEDVTAEVRPEVLSGPAAAGRAGPA
jgi:PAS domain-containing protein